MYTIGAELSVMKNWDSVWGLAMARSCRWGNEKYAQAYMSQTRDFGGDDVMVEAKISLEART